MVGIILKIVSHLGQISGDLQDFEQTVKDLFAGKLTRDEVTKLLSDVSAIVSGGIISVPGADPKAIVAAIGDGSKLVDDVISAIKDVQAGGISAGIPDIKKIASDLYDLVGQGLVPSFGGFTKEQAMQMLQAISAGI